MTTETDSPSENSLTAWEQRHRGWSYFLFIVTGLIWLKFLLPLSQVAMVYWVYGKTGYDSGIRVGSKGRALWFTDGEPVPDLAVIACSFGTIFVAGFVLCALELLSKWLYDRFRSKSKSGAS